LKTIVVISVSRAVGRSFVAQIRRFFGASVPLLHYCLNDDFNFVPGEVIAVLTGAHVRTRDKVQALIDRGMDFIQARRAIDYTRIQDLLTVPRGTEVLLVNDFESSAKDAIEHLLRIGLDHLVYHPYFPGARDFPRLSTAVTPGETDLVPEFVERIIDIGSRPVDISTIVELVQRLGLMDQLGDSISSQHLREITRLLREIAEAGRRVSSMRDTLQVVADHAPNGILYTDLSGRVVLGNQTLSTILGIGPAEMTNRPAVELIPGLLELPGSPESNNILPLNGQDMIVREKDVTQGETLVGRIYAFESTHAIQSLEYELRRKARMSEHEARYTFSDILAKDPQMEQLLAFAKRAARGDSTILIQGESGTGKELVAQAIHNASPRKAGPFVPVNFAAFPASLLESELFGYEEGAFTGAKRGGRRGLFAEAHGGTIFLDEIGDAPLEFQVRLLRVLQERQVRPVGGRKLIPIDVRVIAATHKDLAAEIKRGGFREDLYYRLSVIPLRVPGLRERRGDIPPLFDHFFQRLSQGKVPKADAIVAQETLQRLYRYDWPGNVRQLMNAVEYLLNIREDRKLIPVRHLPEYLREEEPQPEARPASGELEEDMDWVLRKLHEHGGCGRRHLAELACLEQPHLTEAMIRGILCTAESLGYLASGRGRKGSVLTHKGRQALHELGVPV
jgi:transcriptional regulator with PAS, ATPase and Fis domain